MTKVEPAATFPRSARLLTPTAYSAVFEQRRARKGRWFHLHLGPRSTPPATDPTSGEPFPASPGLARIGIAVPKKLLKTAVHRNLIKRIARDVFRRTRAGLEARDYVLRLSNKIDPRRQPIDRRAIALDIRSLFSAVHSKPKADPASLPDGATPAC